MKNILFNIFPLGKENSLSFMCADAHTPIPEVMAFAQSNNQHAFVIGMMGFYPAYYHIPICSCNPIIAVAHEYALEKNKIGSLFALVESLLSTGVRLYERRQYCFDDAVPGQRIFIDQGKTQIIQHENQLVQDLLETECMSIKSVQSFYSELQTYALTSDDMDSFTRAFVQCGEKVTHRIMQQSTTNTITQN